MPSEGENGARFHAAASQCSPARSAYPSRLFLCAVPRERKEHGSPSSEMQARTERRMDSTSRCCSFFRPFVPVHGRTRKADGTIGEPTWNLGRNMSSILWRLSFYRWWEQRRPGFLWMCCACRDHSARALVVILRSRALPITRAPVRLLPLFSFSFY